MSHISFSELRNWLHCPHYHKVNHIDGLRSFNGNLFTSFGKALHEVAEKLVLKEVKQEDSAAYFKNKFFDFVDELEDKDSQDGELFEQMIPQGEHLAKLIFPALVAEFGKFELVGVEELIYEDIEKPEDLEIGDRKFKGFIDLIIKAENGKHIILDWKTCGWGWDQRKKTDPKYTYQLVYYKNFFAKKHGIDPKDIEVYFALLKRTAKKDNVEIFRVTSGPRKTKNALKMLHNALHNIEKKNYVKNRLNCEGCELFRTEHCKRN